MRLFIAINLDTKAKEKVVSVQDQLRKSSIKGNFSREENLHLTLAFLGEVDSKKVIDVKEAMDKVPVLKYDLTFRNIGSFNRDNGDIWWIGVDKCEALLEMHKVLFETLIKVGFTLEKRKFVPHLTIAREVVYKEKPQIKFDPFFTTANKISLMKSERINGKLFYTEIYIKKLC